VIRLVRVVALSLLGANSLAAQTVFRPAPPLDSARAELRDALLVLRDSLVTIDGAAARLQRDYRAASGPALLSRARVMHDACARSVRTLPVTRRTLSAARLTEPSRIKRRQELVAALDQLKVALSRCETEFSSMSEPGQAETVRGYANDRASRVQRALRSYDQTVRDFLNAMGIRVMPLGVNPNAPTG
jgi:hypothetical protein